jgi:hypothetical protein
MQSFSYPALSFHKTFQHFVAAYGF